MAKQQRRLPQSKPIAEHAVFPAVTALWFGAVFGLSSLAIRPSLIESLIVRSGIDLFVPATAPPLGLTARILLALATAAAGVLLGVVVASRIALPLHARRERRRNQWSAEGDGPRVRVRDTHPDAPTRRPISAHEEFGLGTGSEPIQPLLVAPRRRSLTIDSDALAIVPDEVAPLPDGTPQALDREACEPDAAVSQDVAPLDLGTFRQPDAQSADANPSHRADDARQTFQPVDALLQAAAVTLSDAAARDGRQIFGMGPVEPQALADRQVFGALPSQERVPSVFAEPMDILLSSFEPLSPAPRDAVPSERIPALTKEGALPAVREIPTAELGLVDLAVRLQESMHRRRATRATAVADEERAESQPSAVDAVTAGQGGAPPARFPRLRSTKLDPAPLAMPAALRPLNLDDDPDDDKEVLASLLPPRRIVDESSPVAANASPAKPHEIPDQPLAGVISPVEDLADDAESEEFAEADYGSLLNVPVEPQPRGSVVRIGDAESGHAATEPVVIFPGQTPREITVIANGSRNAEPFRDFDAPDHAGPGQPGATGTVTGAIDFGDAERALRAALANLQRMSGAA